MSDSDDDKPISELIRKRKLIKLQESKNNESSQKKSKVEVKEEPSKSSSKSKEEKPKVKTEKKEEKTTKVKEENETKSRSVGTKASRSNDFYEDTDKGKLVQSLLVRWWYAMEWPKKEEIGVPPEGYESLNGFSGVFISTKSESLGTILDLRNKETSPCLKNFSKWSSEKLKETCMKAIENQMEILKQHEGEDCKLILELKSELKKIKKIDPSKADKEARKYVF